MFGRLRAAAGAATPRPRDHGWADDPRPREAEAELDALVSTEGFGVRFQTRDLSATSAARLTISSARASGEWASVQLVGRLARVDALASSCLAGIAIVVAPPPLPGTDDDARANEPRSGRGTPARTRRPRVRPGKRASRASTRFPRAVHGGHGYRTFRRVGFRGSRFACCQCARRSVAMLSTMAASVTWSATSCPSAMLPSSGTKCVRSASAPS